MTRTLAHSSLFPVSLFCPAPSEAPAAGDSVQRGLGKAVQRVMARGGVVMRPLTSARAN
jgi:hypothetical protein